MTADVSIALHWMEGHLAALEHEAAGHEHAWRAATCVSDQVLARDALAAVRAVQAQWREVIRRTTKRKPRQGDDA